MFATVAGLDAADFAVTRANPQCGGRDLNPITHVFSAPPQGWRSTSRAKPLV